MDKGCSNCVYVKVLAWEYPCRDCYDSKEEPSLWKPMTEERTCETCVHHDEIEDNPVCHDCFDHSQWSDEPITPPADEENVYDLPF